MADEKIKITGLTELTTPADADVAVMVDASDTTQAATGTTKWISWANLKAGFKTYFDTLYATIASVPVKAAGSDLITGTNDNKFATAKALKDGGFVPVKLISTVAHRQFWIGNAKPKLTSGCAASAQIEMGTNKNVYDYLAFDKDTVEYAYANVAMPESYTGGTVYAQFYWTHPATTTNFKVSWGLGAVSFSNDDTLDAAVGTVIYSNDEGGTTSDLYISPPTAAITIAGTPVAGDYVNWRISRKADDGTNDTLAVDAYLLGVLVWYPVA